MAHWITTEKAKNVSAFISGVASLAAVLIALLKPSSEVKAGDAYVLMREEMMAQREDIRSVNKTLADMGVLVATLRERETGRGHMMLGFEMTEQMLVETPKDGGLPPRPPVEAPKDDKALPPPPKVAMPKDRPPLPPRQKLF